MYMYYMNTEKKYLSKFVATILSFCWKFFEMALLVE